MNRIPVVSAGAFHVLDNEHQVLFILALPGLRLLGFGEIAFLVVLFQAHGNLFFR
jgi:hypothetical protein